MKRLLVMLVVVAALVIVGAPTLLENLPADVGTGLPPQDEPLNPDARRSTEQPTATDDDRRSIGLEGINGSALVASVPGVTSGWDYDDWLTWLGSSVQAFWAREYQQVGSGQLVPLKGGYRSVVERPYPCNDGFIAGDSWSAFYCGDEALRGDFIAIDHVRYGSAYGRFGVPALVWVVAHEWGHALQRRIPLPWRSMSEAVREGQADCFAGVYIGSLYRGENAVLRANDTDLATIRAFLEANGQPARYDDVLHGASGGPAACVGY